MDKKIVMSLETIMGDRCGKYSKYIIQDRALPDVRDGLKPVQRRILYSMYKEGNLYSKPYRKSAKTVGNVIGNYHPHGDTSVYDAMVSACLEPLRFIIAVYIINERMALDHWQYTVIFSSLALSGNIAGSFLF